MNNDIRQFKFMERKWQDDNLSITEEKARISMLCKKLKKELKKTRGKLSKYEQLKPLGLNNDRDDDDDDDKEDGTVEMFSSISNNTSGIQDPTILKAQLKDCRNQVCCHC